MLIEEFNVKYTCWELLTNVFDSLLYCLCNDQGNVVFEYPSFYVICLIYILLSLKDVFRDVISFVCIILLTVHWVWVIWYLLVSFKCLIRIFLYLQGKCVQNVDTNDFKGELLPTLISALIIFANPDGFISAIPIM